MACNCSYCQYLRQKRADKPQPEKATLESVIEKAAAKLLK